VRRAAALLALTLALPGGAGAQQGDTLADIRQALAVLQVELGALRGEMSTTAAPGLGGLGTTASVLERIDAIEAELRRLTAATEAAQFRVERVARDGANRLDDLRFQLCELTPDCDLADLPEPRPLGDGGTAGTADAQAGARPTPRPEAGIGAGAVGAAPAEAPAPQLAAAEQAAFDAARSALEAGDAGMAAEGFGRFVDAYPTGPLTVDAHYLRGEALARSGDTQEAARSYLQAFSGAPEGPRAAAALLGLGRSLGALGQTDEACLTLQEVEARFPGTAVAPDARAALASLGCS
jgi:tol-pal system protein YbgF